MKPIISILLIILLSSCSTGYNTEVDSYKKELSSKKNQNLKKLIGDWGIYVYVVNGNGLYCYSCPKVKFEYPNSATITLPSGEKEQYKWSVSANSVIIEFVGDKISEPYLLSSKYAMSFDQKEEFIELTLSLTEKKSYILRK